MADLERRRGSGVNRRSKERRAYNLVLAGGTAGAVAVVTFVLAVIDVIGFGIPVLAAVVAIICLLLLRRIVGR